MFIFQFTFLVGGGQLKLKSAISDLPNTNEVYWTKCNQHISYSKMRFYSMTTTPPPKNKKWKVSFLILGWGGGGGGQWSKSLISEYETKSQIEAVCW